MSRTDRFVVYLTHLDYQPWDLDHLPRNVIPRRPWQILRDRPPGDERLPSPFANLDFLVNTRLNSSARQTAPAHPERATYIGAREFPYELLVNCDEIECNADVYSERSRFTFRLEFSRDGLVHTSDLVSATDQMIESWAPADGEIARHWRDPTSSHAPPLELDDELAACDEGGYTLRSLDMKSARPSFVATNARGDVFIVSNGSTNKGKLYKFAADQFPAAAPKPQLLSDDLGMIETLTTDAQGRLYVTRSPGKVDRTDPNGFLAGHFFNAMTLPTERLSTLRFAPNGEAVYIDLQAGKVLRRSATDFGTRDTVIGSEFDVPSGLAIAPSGAVYVADESRRLVISLSTDGGVRVLPVKFRKPGAVAIDANGSLFVLDNSVSPIKRISASGEVCAITRHIPRSEYVDIAVDRDGRVFATGDGMLDEFDPVKRH